MRRLALTLVLVLVPFAAACGGTADDAAPEGAAPPSRRGLFVARPAGPAGPLTAYDARSLGRLFRLPAGLARRTARPLRAAGVGAAPVRSDHRRPSGARLASVGDGRSRRSPRPAAGWRSSAERLASVSSTRSDGRAAHDLELAGDFLVETRRRRRPLPLPPADLRRRHATPSAATTSRPARCCRARSRRRRRPVLMQGLASGTVASPDGRWLLTLYVDTRRNAAFVHALNLERAASRSASTCRRAGTARSAQLRRWALALAPDGRTLLRREPGARPRRRGRTCRRPASSTTRASRPDRAGGERALTRVAPDGSRLLTSRTAARCGRTTRTAARARRCRAPGAVAGLGRQPRRQPRSFVARPASRAAGGGALGGRFARARPRSRPRSPHDLDDVAVRVEDAQLAVGAVAAGEDLARCPSSSRSEPSSRACGSSSRSVRRTSCATGMAVPASGREVHDRRLEPVARREPLVLGREDPVVRRDLLARVVALAVGASRAPGSTP